MDFSIKNDLQEILNETQRFNKHQDITSNTRTEVTQQDNELSAVTKTVRNIFNERMIFCKKPHNVIFAEY